MNSRTAILLLFQLLTLKGLSNDTLFLKRVVRDTPFPLYNAIYIADSSKVSFRKNLDDFSWSSYDTASYEMSISEIMNKGAKKINWGQMPRQWTELFQYKEELFNYVPSDMSYGQYRVELNDSVYVDHTIEGVLANRIENFKRRSLKEVSFDIVSTISGKTHVKIKQLNKSVAIFSFSNGKTKNKKLMVDKTQLNNYRTIVNYCITDRVEEFKFDKIDYSHIEKRLHITEVWQ